jgi:hypothetical protein
VSPVQWQRFFEICADTLGKGHSQIGRSQSWCSWTTFDRLATSDAGYWTHGLPQRKDIHETHIGDGGAWGQPFGYEDLAHILIPRAFVRDDGTELTQDLELLASRLSAEGIPFRKTELVLEIKLY